MRCRACGKKIDDNSRFCSFCDCDNYPEMNQVKVKGNKPEVMNEQKTVQNVYTKPSINTNRQSPNAPQNVQAGKGCAGVIIGIFIALFILVFVLSNLEF